EALEHAIDLRFGLRTALFPLGEFQQIFGRLREAEGLAKALNDQRRLGRMAVYMCHNLYITGHPTEALASGQSAQALAESLGDLPLKVTATLYLGAACLSAGDYPRAVEFFAQVPHLLGGLARDRLGQTGFPAPLPASFLPRVFGGGGELAAGTTHGKEAIRLAETFVHPYSRAWPHWVLASLQMPRGELSPAIGLIQRGLTLSREW